MVKPRLHSRIVRRAFTLVELIVVIVVLAILGGVAIPKYFDHANKASITAAAYNAKAISGVFRDYVTYTSPRPAAFTYLAPGPITDPALAAMFDHNPLSSERTGELRPISSAIWNGTTLYIQWDWPSIRSVPLDTSTIAPLMEALNGVGASSGNFGYSIEGGTNNIEFLIYSYTP